MKPAALQEWQYLTPWAVSALENHDHLCQNSLTIKLHHTDDSNHFVAAPSLSLQKTCQNTSVIFTFIPSRVKLNFSCRESTSPFFGFNSSPFHSFLVRFESLTFLSPVCVSASKAANSANEISLMNRHASTGDGENISMTTHRSEKPKRT